MVRIDGDNYSEEKPDETYCQAGKNGLECVTYKNGKDVPEVQNLDRPFENKMYRVSDAETVERLFQDRQIVLIEAPMGGGKSSVMKSLIALYDPSEVLYFQGHHFQSSSNATAKLTEALAQVTPQTRILVVDSSDYLYQAKEFINASKGAYDERSKDRIRILAEFLRDHPDVKCVLPVHDENWAKIRANPELKALFDENFRDPKTSAVFNPSYSINPTHVVRFLEHELGLEREQAWFVANIYTNPVALEELQRRGYLDREPDERGNTFQDLLRSSMIQVQMFKRFPTLKERIKKGFADKEEEDKFVRDYVDAALAIDYRTTFLPILQQARKKQREAIWGAFDTMDGSTPSEDTMGSDEE